MWVTVIEEIALGRLHNNSECNLITKIKGEFKNFFPTTVGHSRSAACERHTDVTRRI